VLKGACEKLKEETNAQDEHIRKILKELNENSKSPTNTQTKKECNCWDHWTLDTLIMFMVAMVA